MCDRRVKQENKTKIERLIEAIEKLSHKMDQAQWSAPSAPADKLKAQIDRLEKLIG